MCWHTHRIYYVLYCLAYRHYILSFCYSAAQRTLHSRESRQSRHIHIVVNRAKKSEYVRTELRTDVCTELQSLDVATKYVGYIEPGHGVKGR